MSDDGNDDTDSGLLQELSEVWSAAKPLLRRLPRARKAIDKLTGGLGSAGADALKSRLLRYRTGNLLEEAQQVAGATGLPVPSVIDTLSRQRRIDELTLIALQRVGEMAGGEDECTVHAPEGDSEDTTDRWFHTLYEEAGKVDEADVREAFVRILAGEIQIPGSFSLRTLRIMGGVGRLTAQRFRRAASVSIRLTPDGNHIIDARVPAIGGALGQNCLQREGLSYDVLTDLSENGLVHTDYRSYHPYGPMGIPPVPESPFPYPVQMPFAHQGENWMLVATENPAKAQPVRVEGAKLTSCGVELLRIVDIESLPDFTTKLVEHFSQSGHRMLRAR